MNKILEIKNISKIYPGVLALDDVSFSFNEGEVHAIMGENGAGKSTLIKIIGGAIKPSSGKLSIFGNEYDYLTPQTSMENGIGVIYQELNLVPSLSVADNVCLGNKLGNKFFKNKNKIISETRKILKELGLEIDPEMMLSKLSTGQQQMVEIAKSMIKNCKILILDEPTSSLSSNETKNLLDMVQKLKKKGVTIIYISHRLEEVFQISDRITILRDGKYMDTVDTKSTNRHELIKLMVGRDIGDEYPKRSLYVQNDATLEVKNLCGQGDKNISFTLHKGEVLGVFGLVGSGRTEMAKMIYGSLKKEEGEIIVHGKSVNINKPSAAKEKGIGLISEDRKKEGVFLDYTINWNIPIMAIKKLSNSIFIDTKKVKKLTENYVDSLSIVTPSIDQYVRNLSGGNQQKVAIAKTLATDADILIMDEPTRGIDVGAKQEIYKLINKLVSEGNSILMISSEMEELIGMCDRIIVFYEGEITGEVKREEFDQNKIMALASGIV